MLSVVKSEDRGKTNWGWLESYHSFSFGEYYDPENINFGPIRVINDDKIQGGSGFPRHPHNNMEIVTVVLKGAVAHQDSTGGKGTIQANEVQRMTAGTGVFHSEINASEDELLHLLQIWFIPNQRGLEPSYEQRKFSHEDKKNKLLKIVSGNKNDDVIFVNQDVKLYISEPEKGIEQSYKIEKGRGVYFYLYEGSVNVNGELLSTGDALKVTDEDMLTIKAKENSGFIVFDVIPD